MATTNDNSASFQRFGMPDSPPKGRESKPTRRWILIRNLRARHRPAILDHLLQLDLRDRYLRFGTHVNADHVRRYVASIDFRRDEVFGVFNRRLELVAIAHLAALPRGPGEERAMEFGVSVLPQARGQGLGLRLFHHAMVHARNRGASMLVIHALTENDAMLRIAHQAGATLADDGDETEAWLRLPADTFGTHLDSSMQSAAAETVYRIRYWFRAMRDLIRLMLSAA